jgi:L-asparagine transporter-like permease
MPAGEDHTTWLRGENVNGQRPATMTDASQAHMPAARMFVLLLATAVLVMVFFSSLKELFTLSLRSELYSHIPLMPVISLCLLYTRRKEIFSEPKSSVAGSAPLLAVGSILYLIGMWQESVLKLAGRQ